MDSCRDDPKAVPAPETPRVHPEPQRDQADDTPLTVPRQAHLQRDYTTLGQIATTGEEQATASGAVDLTTDERNAPGKGTRVEAATNTASEPFAPPPGAAPPWGRGHQDYAGLEGDASHPSEQAEQEATQDLGFWIPRLVTGEQLELTAYDGYFLRGPATSRREHAPWQTSRLVIGQGTRPPPPWTTPANGAMWPPGSWRIWKPTAKMKRMDCTGGGTSAPPSASVRPCRTIISGTSLDHRATRDTPEATGGRGPKMSRSPPGRRRAGTLTGSTTWQGVPLWHIQQPPAAVRPTEEPGQSPRLEGARRHAGAAPRDESP